MGNSQSSPTEVGLVHRAECRETPASGCCTTELAFQNQYAVGEKVAAAGLTSAAFQQELDQVNAIWTAGVGGAKGAYQSLSMIGIVVGVAIVIITTLTSDSCTTTSRSSTRRSSSTSCSEIPGGAIVGFVLLGLGLVVYIIAASLWQQKANAAMAAIGTHLNTVVAPRWAGMGIGWRTGSYSERSGKNNYKTIYYIEAFLSPEAAQRVGMMAPTATVVQQQPLSGGGAPWQGGYVPTAQEAQGQPMMMPIMPQPGAPYGGAPGGQPGGAFAYPAGAPMPGGYAAYGGAQVGGQAAAYDEMDKLGSSSAPAATGGPYTLPPNAANYAYTYGGYPPPPGQPQAWQQPGGGPAAGAGAQGHAAFGYAGSAPPVSDRTL